MTVSDYNKCVDNHADALYRFILKNVKENAAAQDIVQDAFMKMWEKRREVASEKAKSYLFTIAYHTLVDHARREKRFAAFDETFEEPKAETNNYFDVQAILNKAIERLPSEQKRVLLLRDYEGYSYEEIGEITGLNKSQVKVYIYRARLFLKKYIGKAEAVI